MITTFLSIDQLFRNKIAIFMFKLKTKWLPSIFENIFQLSEIEQIEAKSKTRIIPKIVQPQQPNNPFASWVQRFGGISPQQSKSAQR